MAIQAYRLYEKCRPEIAAGAEGWGAAGELDLDSIEALSRHGG
jgi:hypothetical protein